MSVNVARSIGEYLSTLGGFRKRWEPLTRDQVGKLVAGGVPSHRAAALVMQHGVDFLADGGYLNGKSRTPRIKGLRQVLKGRLFRPPAH